MKAVTWSYSSLELYKQCPHKYYRLSVKKDVVVPPTEATSFGKAMHKACEDYIKLGTPIPEVYSFAREPMEKVRDLAGTHLCEYRMGLTRDLEKCDFFAKDVWYRGIVDLVVIDGDVAKLIDYKSSKSAKYAETKQLEIMSLAIFKHFPEVKKIKAGLLFFIANAFVPATYTEEESGIRWTPWLSDVAKLEKAVELGIWNPKPNFTCAGWCPVTDCQHWKPKPIKFYKK